MNAKVAKMLRKTGRDSHAAKKWWNGLSTQERGELRADYNKFKDIQNRAAHHDAESDEEVAA